MNLTDIRNFIGKLTAKKLLNIAKIYASFFVAKWFKKPIHWGMPFNISFEPTTFCNLRCPECPSGLRSFTRPTGMLRKDFFSDTINEIADTLVYLYFYFQGEPYLNPNFLDMVQYASNKGIYTVTSTNAHYLTEENCVKTIESGLNRIIISIDGTTQATYEAYRVGGNLQKVLDGAATLVRLKKERQSATPHIVFQFLVVKPNEHQIEEVKTLAKEIGVDEVVYKTAQIYDYKNGSPLIPCNQKYARYQQQPDGTYRLKNKLLNQCWKMWHSCVITWDGRMVPCCFDKDAQYEMGNLHRQSFSNIWRHPKYQQFRQSILYSRKNIDICTNCSEGTRVFSFD